MPLEHKATRMQTDATTPNIAGPTMLGVSCCIRVGIEQLPIMMGPAVYRGKDTTLKTLETCAMRVPGL